MRLVYYSLLLFFFCSSCGEKSSLPSDPIRSNQTWSYHEGIAWWDSLADYSNRVELRTFGMTDAGYPLHLAMYNAENQSLDDIRQDGKLILLINNAIHPGEPDGVDASMAFFRELAMADQLQYDNMVIVCIPYYNIGGALNRNSHSRTNQDGPESYGFRGNAQNLDLNRDFVKMDSRNAQSFAQLTERLDPDVYLETHVSNGADYSYTMTYLPTQADKLGYGMGGYMRKHINPVLEDLMKTAGFPMVPYVNVHGTALDSSYTGFYDSPRYSTGLMALRQSYGYITETHMLKPYDQRVSATLAFIRSLCGISSRDSRAIQGSRTAAKQQVAAADSLSLDWALDESRVFRYIDFAGYEYGYKASEIHGEDRLYYDVKSPRMVKMKYLDYFNSSIRRAKPQAYVIQAGYHQVLDRLRLLGVDLQTIENDTSISVVSYRITNFETSSSPYEKHYYHYNTNFERDTIEWSFREGDVLIYCNSDKARIVMELLEPDGPDSYFNWNFFDAVLQQKEWYSPYVFEDKAADYLKQDSELMQEFQQMKEQTPGFGENPQWQLYWLYQRSPHYEKEHMRLPVFRIE